MGVPVAFATCASCSRAAGRYTSVETTIGRCPCSASHLPSLPVEVVLPEPCRPTDQPHRRRPRSELRARFAAEQFGQLVAHDFHHLLVGRKLQQHFRTERFLADVRDEFVRDAEVDVGIEQRFADFGERRSRCSSVSFPWPRRFLNARCSLSVSVSNMGHCLFSLNDQA